MNMNLKMNFKVFALALALSFSAIQATAQEIVTEFRSSTEKAPVRRGTTQARFLPFFDDFSHSVLYPDSTKWIDNNVLVNDGFPLCPPNRNGATFDVLDANGRVYSYAISNPFISEYLTSVNIRLDSIREPEPRALTPSDSLYLSFYYQPQGNGNAPEAHDSLVLQFGTVIAGDTTWYHIWSAHGQKLESFMEENGGRHFKQVMIPIRDVKYFTDQFCIRFFNYASIVNASLPSERSNEDNWNIDFVYLDINRSISDTTYPMLAFSGQRPSFFKRYQSIPYRQYRVNPSGNISESLHIDIANLDGIEHEANYYYKVDQIGGGQHYQHTVDPVTILPFSTNGYLSCPDYGESPACPYVGELFALNLWSDSTSYLVRHYVYDSTSMPPLTDSMVYRVGMYNYYAYDDGIPELGYGVSNAGGKFAVKFDISDYDTIQGVQLLFNHTLNDANDKYFDIVVWKDENGKPGGELYRLENCHPIWQDQPYRFTYYPFGKTVTTANTFYIGIEQKSASLINIGRDTSTDNMQYNFVNTNGSWQQSNMPGSLTIRPVVGASYYINVGENTTTPALSLYPNPVGNILNIESSINSGQVNIYDLMGKRVLQSEWLTEIPVGHLNDGLYFLNVITEEGQVINQKFIIHK